MTGKLNPLTAAPSLMKEWHRTSILIASSLESSLSELVKFVPPRSTAAQTALICIQCLRAKMEKPSSAFICYQPGAKLPATPTGNVLRSVGRRL